MLLSGLCLSKSRGNNETSDISMWTLGLSKAILMFFNAIWTFRKSLSSILYLRLSSSSTTFAERITLSDLFNLEMMSGQLTNILVSITYVFFPLTGLEYFDGLSAADGPLDLPLGLSFGLALSLSFLSSSITDLNPNWNSLINVCSSGCSSMHSLNFGTML